MLIFLNLLKQATKQWHSICLLQMEARTKMPQNPSHRLSHVWLTANTLKKRFTCMTIKNVTLHTCFAHHITSWSWPAPVKLPSSQSTSNKACQESPNLLLFMNSYGYSNLTILSYFLFLFFFDRFGAELARWIGERH